MSIYVIGDVHGSLNSLITLIEFISPTGKDCIVFLGDYIDRGENSKGVLDYCIDLKEKYNTVFLQGNHEDTFIKTLNNKDLFNYWLQYGGDRTLQSYSLACEYSSMLKIPKKYITFLSELAEYHETNNYLFSHAPLTAELPIECHTAELLMWPRHSLIKKHVSNKLTVYGHTTQKNGNVFVNSAGWCVDTFACGEGWLTALALPEEIAYQANKKGETRKILVPISDNS